MKFSELLHEAIRTAKADLSEADARSIAETVLELLRGWIEIHEPDDAEVDPQDPQRALVMQLIEELEDRVPIPVVD